MRFVVDWLERMRFLGCTESIAKVLQHPANLIKYQVLNMMLHYLLLIWGNTAVAHDVEVFARDAVLTAEPSFTASIYGGPSIVPTFMPSFDVPGHSWKLFTGVQEMNSTNSASNTKAYSFCFNLTSPTTLTERLTFGEKRHQLSY